MFCLQLQYVANIKVVDWRVIFLSSIIRSFSGFSTTLSGMSNVPESTPITSTNFTQRAHVKGTHKRSRIQTTHRYKSFAYGFKWDKIICMEASDEAVCHPAVYRSLLCHHGNSSKVCVVVCRHGSQRKLWSHVGVRTPGHGAPTRTSQQALRGTTTTSWRSPSHLALLYREPHRWAHKHWRAPSVELMCVSVCKCVWESNGEKGIPALTTIFNQTKAEQFIPYSDVFLAVLMLACWLIWTSHIYALPDELWQFTTTLPPGQSNIELNVVSLFSLSLVSSSPGSTQSGITPPRSTVPCSAGSARPDALQISSWVPCTRCPDRPLPQLPATLSSPSPPPASEMASPSSCQHWTLTPTYNYSIFWENTKKFTHKLLILLYVKVRGSPTHNLASLDLLKKNDTLRIYFVALHTMWNSFTGIEFGDVCDSKTWRHMQSTTKTLQRIKNKSQYCYILM